LKSKQGLLSTQNFNQSFLVVDTVLIVVVVVLVIAVVE